MNKIAAALLITLPLCLGSAFAADKAPTAQQSKMSSCSKDAKTQELKGAERKQFMSTCLKKESDGKKRKTTK